MTHPAVQAALAKGATLADQDCARCDTRMVITNDAVGRPRLRCPVCDGVSQKQPTRPDDAMLPQGLAQLVGTLPPVRPGQLRCQRCAAGVAGRADRLCVGCAPKPGEHICERCLALLPKVRGRPPRVCEACCTPAELLARTEIRRKELARYHGRANGGQP